jgi:hypothetical protein
MSPIYLLLDYYESIKRELNIRCIYECRCDERLQSKTKEFTCLTYTGLVVELEHLKIETRLINGRLYSLGTCPTISFQVAIKHTTQKFVNVMGEYVT